MTLHHEVRGDGPDILLLHAGVADGRMWAPLADRLVAAGHRTIAPDLQGFGRTPLEPGFVSNTADLLALLDELGIDGVTVVGASFGGLVSLSLALRAPERVAGLVLLDATLDEFEASGDLAAFVTAEDAAVDAGDADAVVALNVGFWVDRPGARPAEDVDPAVRDLVATMVRDAYAAQDGIDATFDDDDPPAARRLGEIRAPALVVTGADDVEDFHRIAEVLAAELPGAGPVVTVPRAAHLPALERPDDVAALVIAFLDAPHSAAG